MAKDKPVPTGVIAALGGLTAGRSNDQLARDLIDQMYREQMYKDRIVYAQPAISHMHPNVLGGLAAVTQGPGPENRQWRSDVLASRLRLGTDDMYIKFPGFATTYTDTKIFVHFAGDDDTLVVLEDSRELYPSDVLVTRMRLCIK